MHSRNRLLGSGTAPDNGRSDATGEDAREDMGVSKRVESRPNEPMFRLDDRTGEICIQNNLVRRVEIQ